MKLQGLFKFAGPILLTLLAMALAHNRMDVKTEHLVTHDEQGQYIGYRQSKWLEKFKRPKPPKSHYGKPKAYFKAPKPQYGAPVTTHYTPPQASYYENPYKSQYPAQPSYVPSAARPPQVNYFQNPLPYNQPQAVYRTPASNPSHPSFSQPEVQNNPAVPVYQEPVNSNPTQPPLNYVPSQPVSPASAVYTPPVNTNPTQPLFGPSGLVNDAVPSEAEDYRNQIHPSSEPTPDYVPSHPVNPTPTAYVPPVTHNQQEPHNHPEPAIVTPLKDYKEQINNNPPQFAVSHQEPLNDPTVQDYRAPENEESQQYSLDHVPSEPVNPSVYQLPVENNPGQLPFSHPEPVNNSPLSNFEELANNNPLQSSYSQPEPVNQPQPSYEHREPTNNSPQGLGEHVIDNPPQPPHGHHEFANSPPTPHRPQPPHIHQEFVNSPQPPHSPQPVHSPQQAHIHQEFANSPQLPHSPPVPHSPQPPHSHPDVANNQPISGHSEKVNNNLPQPFHAHQEAIPNHPRPSSHGHSNPNNTPSPVHENPSQSFYSQQGPVNNPPPSHFAASIKNNPPQASLDYIPSNPSHNHEGTAFNQPHAVQELQQPAHTEAPHSTPKPLSHNGPAQDSFFPTEATSQHPTTSSPVVPMEHQASLNFPNSPFSTNVEEEISPLFYNEFRKSERNQQDPDAGFFEFGIFPKSNSFFLQNYRG
ncbi:hypothetical protein GHT06_019838 [Daphnia sinensis]|uniref:Uncharacterized protein n=1 Tax=Daphnia sinensis TaxID=1820382 RepID=A0AAD5PTG2_9CRUS|nr:hypothetical protein GHT06_019838 [Daphnia sinensis]